MYPQSLFMSKKKNKKNKTNPLKSVNFTAVKIRSLVHICRRVIVMLPRNVPVMKISLRRKNCTRDENQFTE